MIVSSGKIVIVHTGMIASTLYRQKPVHCTDRSQYTVQSEMFAIVMDLLICTGFVIVTVMDLIFCTGAIQTSCDDLRLAPVLKTIFHQCVI